MTANLALHAVTSRRSIRRFLPDAVPDDVVRQILAAASRAASGTNIQPWLIHVVTGEAQERLSVAVTAAAKAGETSLEYEYEATELGEPYLSRKRQIAYELYARYGIARDDYAARRAAMLRNFNFFGAPVGLFFTMERSLGLGAWIDCGMYMQNVMVVARLLGLDTCPQQSWCHYGAVVHRELQIPAEHIVLSGMALGHAAPDAPENSLVSPRADVAEFTTWHR